LSLYGSNIDIILVGDLAPANDVDGVGGDVTVTGDVARTMIDFCFDFLDGIVVVVVVVVVVIFWNVNN
jgi:hypothetical protein